ncbi:hypothetical protein FA15DRAFT_553037, partial [Coprinopsis marcescibilis]
TTREILFRDALAEAEERDLNRKNAMVGMQAQVILQGLYVREVNGHLQAHGEQKAKKKESNLPFGDGLPKLLTSDEFTSNIEKRVEQKQQDEEEKELRAEERKVYMEKRDAWKKAESERVARNDTIREEHQKAVEE